MTAPLRQSEPVVVPVALGARTYDVVIGRGLLASLGERIKTLRFGARVAVVTDETVATFHLAAAEAALRAAGIECTRIVVPAGETSKNYTTFETVCEAIIAARVERSDVVVAFGGGVVGDLAGFAAACARRGLDFVQVPTTLLAQVDSSVGGKTGINSRHGKNLVGAFHQPILVVADSALLDTLPKRQFHAGYAGSPNMGCSPMPLSSRGSRRTGRTSLPGVPQGITPSQCAAVAKPGSWGATSERPANVRCSISATPSATRLKPAADSQTGCCMARRWRWEWPWHSNFRQKRA